MKSLIYTGVMDARGFTANDLERLGVEELPDEQEWPELFDEDGHIYLKPGMPREMPDEVAEALGKVFQIREATEEEVEAERDRQIIELERELGFKLYDPDEHNVQEVVDEMMRSSPERTRFILGLEKKGQNRKGIIEAVEGTPEQPDEPDESTDH